LRLPQQQQHPDTMMAASSNASKISSRLDMMISPSSILTMQAVNLIGRFKHLCGALHAFWAYVKKTG
jgi:hypothetical protein